MTNFGKIFKSIRKKEGLNQTEMADILGVSRNTITLIEIGKNIPTTKILLRIMEKMGYSANELFDIENINVSKSVKFNQFYNTLSFLFSSFNRLMMVSEHFGLNKNAKLQLIFEIVEGFSHLLYKGKHVKSLTESYEDISKKGKDAYDDFFQAIVILSVSIDILSSSIYMNQDMSDEVRSIGFINNVGCIDLSFKELKDFITSRNDQK